MKEGEEFGSGEGREEVKEDKINKVQEKQQQEQEIINEQHIKKVKINEQFEDRKNDKRDDIPSIQQQPHHFHHAIQDSIAHLRCQITSIQENNDEGHHLILAQVQQAYVHPCYWSNVGKCFVSKGNYPPILKFLGSQCFGFVLPSGDEFPV